MISESCNPRLTLVLLLNHLGRIFVFLYSSSAEKAECYFSMFISDMLNCMDNGPVSLPRAAKLFPKALVSHIGQLRFFVNMAIKPSVQTHTAEAETVLYQYVI